MNVFAVPPQEDIMAPRSGPTLQGVQSKLRQFQAMAGGSLIGQMEERGSRQKEHWGLGRRSPMPLTEGDMNIADSLAGSLMGTIKAFHGSPHRFDKFSLDKIGTGEGAQAYGHGLYFAESEGVARSYRDALKDVANRGKPLGRYVTDAGDVADLPKGISRLGISDDIRSYNHDEIVERARQLRADAEKLKGGAKAEEIASADEMLRWLDENPTFRFESDWEPGQIYTTKLNVEPEDLLDWDLPLSQQSEKVRAALRKVGFDPEGRHASLTGGAVHEHSLLVPGAFMDKAKAAAALRDAGIPGIRYLDQGSRLPVQQARKPVDEWVRSIRGYTAKLDKLDAEAAALPSGSEAAASMRERIASERNRVQANLDNAKEQLAVAEKYNQRLIDEAEAAASRNIVIFDDSLVEITHVDGKPLTKAERKAALKEMEGKSP